MICITFSVSLVSNKGYDLKKPKTRTISCNINETLHDLHFKILNSYNLPDIYYFAFFRNSEPYPNLDYEWGGSSEFYDPMELMSRTILHKAMTKFSSDSEDEVTEYANDYLNELMSSGSHEDDILPFKDTKEKILSDCSFKKNDTFHYICDFGDIHSFFIKVTDATTKRNSTAQGKKTTKAKKKTKKVKSKKKKARKQMTIYEDPYEDKISKLIENISRDYPDKFFKEIVETNDDEFTFQLLRKLNYYLRDYSQDFLLERFFSSKLSYSQLCSLFLNQVQLQIMDSDVLSTSFLTFSSALYCSNQQDFETEFKNLLMKLLFLYFDVLNPEIIDKFIHHFKNVFGKNWDIFTVEKYWKDHFSTSKLETLMKYFIKFVVKRSGLDTDELDESSDVDEEENWFLYSLKVSLYEIPSYKTFLYSFFLVYPDTIPSLVNFVLDPEISLIKNTKNWVIPLVELLAEHSDLNNYENLELLEPFIDHGDGKYRIAFTVTCWLISKDLTFVRKLKNDNSKRIEKKIERILDDPAKYEKSILDKRKKFWSKTKNLRKNYQNNQIQYINNPDFVYVLKITLKGTKVSRIVGIIGSMSLFELHIAIQDYFDFDDDHLYGFFLNNNPYSHVESYYSPDDSGGRPVTEKLIFDCNLYKGKEILYIFDFGDDLRFKIEVVDIRPKSSEEENFPYLISKKGKSLEQYPDYY